MQRIQRQLPTMLRLQHSLDRAERGSGESVGGSAKTVQLQSAGKQEVGSDTAHAIQKGGHPGVSVTVP